MHEGHRNQSCGALRLIGDRTYDSDKLDIKLEAEHTQYFSKYRMVSPYVSGPVSLGGLARFGVFASSPHTITPEVLR